MKILLDENLPKRLAKDFSEHDVFTVRQQGWNGKQNSELLKAMIAEKFEVLVTFDKNLQHQQNFATYPLMVLVLGAKSNSYGSLCGLIPKIKIELARPFIAGVKEIKI